MANYGAPPPGSAYPPQSSYPPQQGGYPPQQGGYPPQQGGYPPQQGGYPPQQGGYPPQGAPYSPYGAPPMGGPLGMGPGGPMGGMGGGEMCVSITCCGRNLDKKDGAFGKSDPFLIISKKEGAKKVQVYKSDVIMKNLNPEFKPFELRASECGGMQNQLTWECFDWDSDGTHDFIGAFQASLDQIKNTNTYQFINPQKKPSKFSKKNTKVAGEMMFLKVQVKQVAPKALPYAYDLVVKGEKLDRKDGGGFGKSDPYLIIKRKDAKGPKKGRRGANFLPVYTSEFVKDNLNPVFKPFQLTVHDQLGGVENATLSITVKDWDDDGKHDLIGKATITAKDFSSQQPIPLIHPKKVGNMGYKNSGVLIFSKCTVVPSTGILPKPPMAIKLKLSAKNLANMDGMMGKSDPYLVIKGPKGTIVKTEVVQKNLNPVWKELQFNFSRAGEHGLDNLITIECHDKDTIGGELIGCASLTIRELTFPQKSHYLVNPHKAGNIGYTNSGLLIVNAFTMVDHIIEAPIFDAYNVKVQGRGLENKDMGGLGKSDPFLMVEKGTKKLHRTNILKANCNPQWDAFVLKVIDCEGPDSPFFLRAYDHDSGSESDLIGEVKVTIRELTNSNEYTLLNPKKVGGMTYKNSGMLVFSEFSPVPGAPYYSGPGASPPPMGGMYGGPPGAHMGGAYPPHQVPGAYPPQNAYPPQGPPGAYPPQQSAYPPQQGGYPPQQGGYPPQNAYPPQGAPGAYPPQQSAYPPQQGGYPPQQQGGYPPQQGGNPQQPGGYPPQQSAYPPQGGNPQQQRGNPPQQGGYPPQQGGNPPQQGGNPQQPGGYPPQQSAYPPQGGSPQHQGGYPPQQQGGNPQQPGGYPPQQSTYPPQGGNPPQQGGNPQQQGGYPPQQGGNPQQPGGYPPQQSAYPPQGGNPQQQGYPPQQGGYPPQQGGNPQQPPPQQ